ncbi:hypothetical protein FACS189494_01340 [Spirochaetia bacterium]|nr:hypothetical protein FACS189494_01340 [Spirochaetia bacterium]
MKRKIFFVAVLFVTAALAFAADPVEGYWISIDGKKVTGGWRLYTTGNVLQGDLVGAKGGTADMLAVNCKKQEKYTGFPIPGKVSEMKIFGTPFIYGFSLKSEGFWSGGKLIDPDNGNIWNCDLIFHAADGKKFKVDTLEVKVKVGINVSQFWRKSTQAEAEGLSNS